MKNLFLLLSLFALLSCNGKTDQSKPVKNEIQQGSAKTTGLSTKNADAGEQGPADNNSMENPPASEGFPDEHAVIIYFDYGLDSIQPLYELEDKLELLIKISNTGMYDGHAIAVDLSDGSLYMYGPDAEKLFEAIKPELEKTDFMKGAKAILRFGPPVDGSKEIEVEIK